MRADAEILSLMYETMIALGFESKCVIRVNNRKILNGLPEFAGFDPAKLKLVLKVLDKLDKQGWIAVEQELLTQVVVEEASEDAEDDDGETEVEAKPVVVKKQPIELTPKQVVRSTVRRHRRRPGGGARPGRSAHGRLTVGDGWCRGTSRGDRHDPRLRRA